MAKKNKNMAIGRDTPLPSSKPMFGGPTNVSDGPKNLREAGMDWGFYKEIHMGPGEIGSYADWSGETPKGQTLKGSTKTAKMSGNASKVKITPTKSPAALKAEKKAAHKGGSAMKSEREMKKARHKR